MSRTKTVVISLIALISIGLSIYFSVWANAWMAQQRTFYAARQRIDTALRALDTPPPNVKRPGAWRAAVDQTTTAIGNILHSPTMVDKQRLLQFEQKLKSKLAGPIDVNTILWIWDQLAQFGPFARNYVADYKPITQRYLDSAITGERIRP